MDERVRPQFVMASRLIDQCGQSSSPFSVTTQEQTRLSVPRRGHVLATVIEVYGEPIRTAVAGLSASLSRSDCTKTHALLFSPRRAQSGPDTILSNADMAAWAIVSMWVTGVAVKAIPVAASLAQAEQWFFGPDAPRRLTKLPSDQATAKAEAALRLHADASAYSELLPYILDPHGPGSRLSVRRDPATRAAQARKRAEGVFYTPADVAEYMAGTCLDGLKTNSLPTVFDPACGTGVFLRAVLQEIKRRHPKSTLYYLASECLYGADIDPWPLDAAAFMLLADSWMELAGQGPVPADVWHRLRLNLVCIDTLLIDPAKYNGRRDVISGRVPISRLFPALKHGPNVILGNPPYADLGPRSDLTELGRTYETLSVKPQANAEIYLPFIEQMIRLADETRCSGAFVLPLSIACNVGTQFSVMRKFLSRTRGHWRFAFFDREPHALFGEDVKTRNAIMLWSRNHSDKATTIATGPLRKWRGESRAAMFRTLRFTEIDNDIQAGIPKIEGRGQSVALRTLIRKWGAGFEQGVHGIGRLNLSETSGADDQTVFVGATAYNFLNVFLRPDVGSFRRGVSLSEHPLHSIRCTSSKDAVAVFAILSSHLAYWWWHMQGDGFHVSRRFIAEFPFGLQGPTGQQVDALAECGAELWARIKTHPIISLNRGRTSLAFTPNGHDDIRRQIDQLLADAMGLEAAFVDELQQFTTRTVAATLREHAITETEEKEYA